MSQISKNIRVCVNSNKIVGLGCQAELTRARKLTEGLMPFSEAEVVLYQTNTAIHEIINPPDGI